MLVVPLYHWNLAAGFGFVSVAQLNDCGVPAMTLTTDASVSVATSDTFCTGTAAGVS